jgi:hypothetical protein
MIGSRQIKPRTAFVVDDGMMVFHTSNYYIDVGHIFNVWVLFGVKKLKGAIGYSSTGTFTADVYIGDDADPTYIVTESDDTVVDLEIGKTGDVTGDPATLIRVEISASSVGLTDAYISVFF